MKKTARAFWDEHSLSIVAISILTLWILLYLRSDPSTHMGSFYGNAIADWSGSVLVILGTKFLIERGSAESKSEPQRFSGLRGFLQEHSLSLFVFVTGCGWAIAFLHMDPTSKWGQVTGNIVSEWLQMLGLVLLTKKFYELRSHESNQES
jgi:hypothetical protein